MRRGDGSVYRPKRRGRLLNVWYYEIRVAGRVRVGTGFPTKAAALEALRHEQKRKARGEILPPELERLTVGEVLDSYEKDLERRSAKSLRSVASRIGLLKASTITVKDGREFQVKVIRAMDLSPEHVEAYHQLRLAAGRDRATIDREVEVWRAAFRLAYRQERIRRVPHFPMFNTDNVRQGFFEAEQVEAVLADAELPSVVGEIVRFVSLTGWRISEVLALRWEQVDRKAQELRLPDSKNGRPRSLQLHGELLGLIERRWTSREFRTRSGPALSSHVFHQKRGRPIAYSTYRKEFAAACGRAGIPGRWTHDFRRTVARNLRRAGVPESVCMSITGHETASVFRRYSIVDGRDQAEALAAVEALVRSDKERSDRERSKVSAIAGSRNFPVTPKEKGSGDGA